MCVCVYVCVRARVCVCVCVCVCGIPLVFLEGLKIHFHQSADSCERREVDDPCCVDCNINQRYKSGLNMILCWRTSSHTYNTHIHVHNQSQGGLNYINYGLAETRCKCHMKYEKDIIYSNRMDIKCWVQDIHESYACMHAHISLPTKRSACSDHTQREGNLKRRILEFNGCTHKNC